MAEPPGPGVALLGALDHAVAADGEGAVGGHASPPAVLPSSQVSVPSVTLSTARWSSNRPGQFGPAGSQFSSGKPVAFSITPSPQTGVVQSDGRGIAA